MTIDRHSDRPMFKQLADIFRGQILSGVYPPGAHLPTEHQAGTRYRTGRGTVRQAIAILRAEGLVDTSPGSGTRVRTPTGRIHIPLGPYDRAITRMPTDLERHHHSIADGVPVIEIHRADTTTELYPADQIEVISQP